MEPEERRNDDKDTIRFLQGQLFIVERQLAIEHAIRCQVEKKLEYLKVQLAAQKDTD